MKIKKRREIIMNKKLIAKRAGLILGSYFLAFTIYAL